MSNYTIIPYNEKYRDDMISWFWRRKMRLDESLD